MYTLLASDLDPEGRYRVVLSHRPGNSTPWSTHQHSVASGYTEGHYHTTFSSAIDDFIARCEREDIAPEPATLPDHPLDHHCEWCGRDISDARHPVCLTPDDEGCDTRHFCGARHLLMYALTVSDGSREDVAMIEHAHIETLH
jgi:hypothetical protein